MNWIHKTLRAAHEQRFHVDIYTGERFVVGGFVKEIDDETIVIRPQPGYGDCESVILICSITSLVPIVAQKEKTES
jgi:hypothetical protein